MSRRPRVSGSTSRIAPCATTTDPARGGPRGPAVAGASIALLESKMIQGKYPAGYKPKRRTVMMPRFPHLKPVIPVLAEYLERSGP